MDMLLNMILFIHLFVCFCFLFFVCFTVSTVSRCTPGSIRLHEGKDEYEGKLQICINWIWEGVTYSYWDYNDAQVACKQLFLFNSTQNTSKLVLIFLY